MGFLMLKLMEGEASPLNRLPREQVADALVDFVGRAMMNDDGESKSQKENDL
jgi:hypothetical protein